MKADRKRLKAEKVDLVAQMKQLYSDIQDKECELRDFIRNFEGRMKENSETIGQVNVRQDYTGYRHYDHTCNAW